MTQSFILANLTDIIPTVVAGPVSSLNVTGALAAGSIAFTGQSPIALTGPNWGALPNSAWDGLRVVLNNFPASAENLQSGANSIPQAIVGAIDLPNNIP